MKETSAHDLRLFLADTKYGVALLLIFYCISLPLALLQRMKQNWGIPGFHELRCIPQIMEMFRTLQEIRSWKELYQGQHKAFRILRPHMKSLENYKFRGIKFERSPGRYSTESLSGIPTVIKNSEPNFRDIIKFIHLYAGYNLEFIPKILKECTHPWSSLAVKTIDPTSLLETITGTKGEHGIILDDNAISMVAGARKPWKDLLNFVLKEDYRLSEVLGMENNNGTILRYIRKQITNCLYFMNFHKKNFL